MKTRSLRIIFFVLIISLFLAASSAHAETAEEYYGRGLASGKQGNLPQAISDLTRAIEADPKYADAYYVRGGAYRMQGNLAQAISDFTKAIEIDPNHAGAYYNRAVVYFGQKDFARAWQDVHKAEKSGHLINPEFLNDLKKASGRDN